MDKFYMVYVENGNNPTFQHGSFKEAETEAKRLAKFTGKRAYVLMAIQSVEINEFNITRITDEEDLPF